MNDERILKHIFTTEQIRAYTEIKNFQNRLGRLLEDYINSFLPLDGIEFVGRDKNRPEGVDYMVDGIKWSVKNAWNTENSSMIKARKINNVNHWFRLNKDQSTNWHNFFIPNVSLSEEGFCDFISAPAPSSLTNFFN